MRWTWRYYNDRVYIVKPAIVPISGVVLVPECAVMGVCVSGVQSFIFIFTPVSRADYMRVRWQGIYILATALVCQPPSYNLSVKCDGKLCVCPARSFIPAFNTDFLFPRLRDITADTRSDFGDYRGLNIGYSMWLMMVI